MNLSRSSRKVFVVENIMDKQNARRGESGNAIFYIMAAIVLLAALTMAVAQGGRGGVQSLTEDRVRLFATETIAYGDAMVKAAATLRLRGLQPEVLEFDTSALTGYDNGACGPADTSCKIFAPAGGGMTYAPVPRDWLNSGFSAAPDFEKPYFAGNVCVPGVGTGDTGCASDAVSNEELVAYVPFMRKEICMEINDLLDVPNEADDAPEMADCPWSAKFTGTFADGVMLEGATPNSFFGKAAGCVKTIDNCGGLSTPSYHFYQVLVAR